MAEHIGDVGGDFTSLEPSCDFKQELFHYKVTLKHNVKPFVILGFITFYVVPFCGGIIIIIVIKYNQSILDMYLWTFYNFNSSRKSIFN